MDAWNTVIMALGSLVPVFVWHLTRVARRVDRFEADIGDMRVEIARQQQENRELHTHIRRIDKNLDDLFRKVDELLYAIRKRNDED